MQAFGGAGGGPYPLAFDVGGRCARREHGRRQDDDQRRAGHHSKVREAQRTSPTTSASGGQGTGSQDG